MDLWQYGIALGGSRSPGDVLQDEAPCGDEPPQAPVLPHLLPLHGGMVDTPAAGLHKVDSGASAASGQLKSHGQILTNITYILSRLCTKRYLTQTKIVTVL